MTIRLTLAAACSAIAISGSPLSAQAGLCQEQTTIPFTGNISLGSNSGMFFDINVLNPVGIMVSELDTDAEGPAGMPFTLEVWTTPGTFVGNQTDASVWSLITTGSGVTAGNNTPSLVEFPANFNLPQGPHGVALRIIGAGHNYSFGNGSNDFYSNPDLTLTLGESQVSLFGSFPIPNRVWNGTLRYNCGSNTLGTNYCEQTTPNSTGQLGRLGATGSDVAFADDFTLVASNVPSGQFAYFIASRTQGFIANPNNSQGNLCILGNLTRFNGLGFLGIISGGSFSRQLPLTNFPEPPSFGVTVLAGDVWNFQLWHRDFLPGSGPTSNFTEGLEVLFQ